MELFVTDLDGTLLNSNKVVSEKTREIINRLIDKGVQFTVATARTPATVVDILKDINIKIPVILMNGVLIYDLEKEEYIEIDEMDNQTVEQCLLECEKFNKNPLIYAIKDNHLWVYHKEFCCIAEENYYKERAEKKQKTFVKVTDYREAIKDSKIINIVSFDSKEKINALSESLKSINGIISNQYEDIYEKDTYFLEIHSDKVSKAKGIEFLSRYVASDKLVCFGDNMNDISMFNLSDECYATANAVEEIKKIATGVIGSCDEDGVASFIENYISEN